MTSTSNALHDSSSSFSGQAVAGQGDLVTPRAMAEALVKTMGVSMQDVPMQDFVNAMALVPALSKARLGHKQPGNGEFAVSTSMLPVPKVVKSVALSEAQFGKC